MSLLARLERRAASRDGYAMAVLMVGIAIMGIMMSVAMPVWHQTMQREKEEELIFRGNQYARAVGLFQRKNANAYPPSLDVLVQQKYLRRKYKDPMVKDGEFQLVPAGAMQAGQVGATPQRPGTGTNQQFGSQMTQGRSTLTGTAQSASGLKTVVTSIAGVVSKSTDKSIRLYNGRDHYNEWMFVYTGPAGRGGGLGPAGGRGGRGRGGQGGFQINPGGGFPQGPGRGRFGPMGPGQFDPNQPPPQFPLPPGGRGRGQ